MNAIKLFGTSAICLALTACVDWGDKLPDTVGNGEEIQLFTAKQSIDLNVEQLDQGKTGLDVFGRNETLTVKARDHYDNIRFWSGTFAGDPNSQFYITEREGAVVGDLTYLKEKYQIRTLATGRLELLRLSESVFDNTNDNDFMDVPLSDLGIVPVADSCVGTQADDDVDIAVYYSIDAMSEAGGRSAIELEAYHAVNVTNQTYSDSGIPVRLNTVLVKELDIDDQNQSILGVLDAVNKPLTTHSPTAEMTHPQVTSDKAAYNFDIGMMLLGNFHSGTVGLAYSRNDPDPGFDWYFNDYASVGVVSRVQAISNLSFPHEIGHIAGNLHDCTLPGNGTSIYDYSHGYCSTSQRTIMGREECSVPRVGRWSNGVVPLGSTAAAGTCSANAVLSYANIGNQLAGYECQNGSLSDVVIKDTPPDDGTVPTKNTNVPGTLTWNTEPYILYNSDDVWTRQQDDGLTEVGIDQNIEKGQDNYIYVNLRNGGSQITGVVEVYYANANTNFVWGGGNNPGDFTLIGTQIVTANANDTSIAKIVWQNNDIPAATIGNHYCLYIRWVSTSDPMQQTETTHVWENTAYNNNVAWQNLAIIDQKLGDTVDFDTEVGTYISFANSEVMSKFAIIAYNKDGENIDFFQDNTIELAFDPQTTKTLLKEPTRKGDLILKGDSFVLNPDRRTFTLPRNKQNPTSYMNFKVIPKESKRIADKYLDVVIAINHFEGKEFKGGFAITVDK